MLSRSRFHRYPSSFSRRRVRRTGKCCGLTLKDILTLLSSLALPLMLGIFTIIITFDQKNLSNKQRLEDRRLADEQRDQDLNISHQQRREDRELAREQRLQDLNQSILQRDLERTIGNEAQNISEYRRIHELQLEDKRYRDNILINYINQISDLLQKNNENLTNISLSTTLVHSKTLTLIHQLDSNRNSQVIRFLYEAGLLNARDKFPLDLSESELFNIDMSSKIYGKKMQNLYLSGVDLTNSSFVNRDLTGSNFSNTILNGVNFSLTTLLHTDFSYAIFNHSFNIYKTALNEINFAYANLEKIDFTKILLSPRHLANDQNRILLNINFINANLANTRFSQLLIVFAHFREISHFIDFSNTTLMHVVFESVFTGYLDFSYSFLMGNVTFPDFIAIIKASFFMAQLNNVTFCQPNGYGLLQQIQFDFAKFQSVLFHGIEIVNSSFINVTMSNMKLLNVTINNVNFDNTIFKNEIIFSQDTHIINSSFRRTQMQNIIADHCEFSFVNMNEANLTNSTMFATHLILSQFINTDFTGVNLSMANLSNSNMLNATINDQQLYSAISIENTILPNGTIAHDIPLIRNGNADCNKIIEQDWQIEPPNSIIITKWKTFNHSFNDENDCMFMAKSSSNKNNLLTKIIMTQDINITRYKSIFNKKSMKLSVNSHCNHHVNIYLIQRDINRQILNDYKLKNYENIYSNINTTDIQIKLQFDINNIAICDNIQFHIKLPCTLCSSN
jgi:uncharacterized protein YjbI with pentapeptide repeats